MNTQNTKKTKPPKPARGTAHATRPMPDNHPRVRRPDLPRSQPRRAFSGILGTREDSKPNDFTAGHAKPAASKPTAETAATGVARGVNAGYRVIEDYLRQGQEFARALWPGTAGGGGGTPSEPMNMTERLVRSASDLAGLFSEFLQTFSIPGMLPPPGSQPIPDFGIAEAGAAKTKHDSAQHSGKAAPRPTGAATAPVAPEQNERVTVSIDVASRQRTEITVDLKAGPWTRTLQVHDLRSGTADAAIARLTGITAVSRPDERRVVIAIRVPPRQAAGTYSGVIVDAKSNLPCGTLSVRVLADD
jgi:hypothetical protein